MTLFVKMPRNAEEATILREKLLDVDAKGTAALAEIDYDLRQWKISLYDEELIAWIQEELVKEFLKAVEAGE